MKCAIAKRLINGHIDNLLKTEQVLKLESHLRECLNCREFFADMEFIVNNSRYLETPGESGNLWTEIKKEVLAVNRNIPGQGSVFRDFPVKAKGIALAVGTLLVILVLTPLIYNYFPPMPWADKDPKQMALNHFELAEEHYQSAVEVLNGVIEDMDVKLSPELMEVFKKNLELIDESIRVCKEAIEQSPKNPEASRLLLICYRKKIELLDELKTLALQTG